MAKPLIVPTFATDALYPLSAEAFSLTNTKTAPPGGKLAEGFEPKEKPAAQYLNWLLHYLGQWASYLNSGALDGPISINGNLSVTGTTTLTGGVTTGTDVGIGGMLSVTGDASLLAGLGVSGNAIVFGKLQVNGLIGHGEDSVTDLVHRAAANDTGVTFSNGGPAPTVVVPSSFVFSIHTPPLRAGCRITKIRISGVGTVGSTAPTFTIKELGFTGALSAAKPFTSVLVGAVTGIFEYTLTITTPAALADGALYVVDFTPAGGVPTTLRSITTFFARTV